MSVGQAAYAAEENQVECLITVSVRIQSGVILDGNVTDRMAKYNLCWDIPLHLLSIYSPDEQYILFTDQRDKTIT